MIGQNSDNQKGLEFGEFMQRCGAKEYQKHQMPRKCPKKDIQYIYTKNYAKLLTIN